MRSKPWEKWTVEGLRQMAKNHGPSMVSEALKDFAALKEAEHRGERCVLPTELEVEEIDTMKMFNGGWCAWNSDGYAPEGIGKTQQAAIEDLARKIKEAK